MVTLTSQLILASNETADTLSSTPTPITTTLPEITKTTDLFATVDNSIYYALKNYFMPDDYDLSKNVYDWNVSEIVHYINESDPTFLYTLDTEALVDTFPEFILKQLPRDVLMYHELYYLLPPEDTSYCANCTLNITNWVECIQPWVHSKHDSVWESM